jgi:hypothetical protein
MLVLAYQPSAAGYLRSINCVGGFGFFLRLLFQSSEEGLVLIERIRFHGWRGAPFLHLPALRTFSSLWCSRSRAALGGANLCFIAWCPRVLPRHFHLTLMCRLITSCLVREEGGSGSRAEIGQLAVGPILAHPHEVAILVLADEPCHF